MVYVKPAISVPDQIDRLRKRGLSISDEKEAEHFLRNVSYYRLAGYWWTLQSDRKRHRFRRGATFTQVIDRYNFDRELRLIALDMIERVEVGIRTRLIYHLSIAYGSHWFEDVSLVKDANAFAKNFKRLKAVTKRSNEVYLREHFKQYRKDKRNPPSWKTLEIVSLGTLSKMYENLKSRLPEKDLLANEVGLPNQLVLENWLHGASVVRNIAAHHNRLFQRQLPIKPNLPDLPGPWIDTKTINTRSVYLQICSLAYLLQKISPGNRFRQRLEKLFKEHPHVREKEVGFPANWNKQALWR